MRHRDAVEFAEGTVVYCTGIDMTWERRSRTQFEGPISLDMVDEILKGFIALLKILTVGLFTMERLAWALIVLMAMSVMWNVPFFKRKYDNNDSPVRKIRSGLSLVFLKERLRIKKLRWISENKSLKYK